MFDQENKINEIHENLVVIKTVLLGANGDKGLVGKVEKTCAHLEELEEKHQALSGKFKLLVGVLVGSGVLGGAAASIIKLLA